jgi:hypothetical protein
MAVRRLHIANALVNVVANQFAQKEAIGSRFWAVLVDSMFIRKSSVDTWLGIQC